MDAQPKKLTFFKDDKIKIVVPFFQRPYVWDEEDWNSLINSIEKASKNTMPFIGSFILKSRGIIEENNEKINEYWVIDGQQRITTINILIKALLETKKSLIDEEDFVSLRSAICFSRKDASGNKYYPLRITPSNADSKAFELVMGDDLEEKAKLKVGKSKITNCYLFFRDYFAILKDDDVRSFVNKLLTDINFFISITLQEEDDEQEIFDSVNSLGKELSNTDIVKNYLYQIMRDLCYKQKGSDVEVVNHYKKYWEEVFLKEPMKTFWDNSKTLGRLNVTTLDNFLKCFGTIKGIYIPSESGGIEKLADSYKRRINDIAKKESYEGLVEFSKELSSYGEAYYKMWDEYGDWDGLVISNRLNSTLFVLEKLGTSTFDPYILKLVQTNDSQKDEKLFALQRFVLKRFLWKASTKNYNKCCLQLLSSDDPNKYLDDYNAETIDVDWTKYPSQVKVLTNKQGTLLTCLIEMIKRKDDESMYDNYVVFNEKTLEHIMPKQWNKNWSNIPSYKPNINGDYIKLEDENEIKDFRNKMINSLGNMTLLRNHLNTSIGNKDIETKVLGEEGKKNDKCIKNFAGGYRITSELVEQLEEDMYWDEKKILEREFDLVSELNDYYHFVDTINQLFDDYVFDTKILNKEYFTESHLENVAIGVLAKEIFTYLLTNDLLGQEEIESLKTLDYSKKLFSAKGRTIWLPILTTNLVKESKNYKRYYKPAIYNGLFLYKEWYGVQKDNLVAWFKEILNKI